MSLSKQIADHLRAVYFGGNWTAVNLKETVADVSWVDATAKLYAFNTIATLVFHTNYYVSAILKVLQGGPLDANDQYSFDCPPIHSQDDWEALLRKTWTDVEQLALLIEQIAESRLQDDFADKKYGSYYRNLHGVVEHMHYHLGQIVLIKKILRQTK